MDEDDVHASDCSDVDVIVRQKEKELELRDAGLQKKMEDEKKSQQAKKPVGLPSGRKSVPSGRKTDDKIWDG